MLAKTALSRPTFLRAAPVCCSLPVSFRSNFSTPPYNLYAFYLAHVLFLTLQEINGTQEESDLSKVDHLDKGIYVNNLTSSWEMVRTQGTWLEPYSSNSVQ